MVNKNCEGIVNLSVNSSGDMKNETRYVKLIETGTQYRIDKVPHNETRTALLGNLFLSQGKSGKVIKVKGKN